MVDAYPDSPLWDEDVAKDIIAKDRKGAVIPGKAWGGVTSYQISYTQEWKPGLAQRRTDGILAKVPELVEGKTIHIDAFLGARRLARQEPISPYLGRPKDVEVATQRKIYRYWRDRGIDVTSEWVDGFRGVCILARRRRCLPGTRSVVWACDARGQGCNRARQACNREKGAFPLACENASHVTPARR